MRKNRHASLEITPKEFKKLGINLVGRISQHLSSLRKNGVTTAPSPSKVRKLLGGGGLPRKGVAAQRLLRQTSELLFRNSLFNGHPRFWGYISGSPAPIGILGDFLASSVNPNVGAFILSPVATEMEAQTVRWIAEMIGYPKECGGLLVSGGNMANFVCFIAARKAKLDWNVRAEGLGKPDKRFRIYVSAETHTWIQKAADLFGFGTDAIRWIPVTNDLRMDTKALRKQIAEDRGTGEFPLMVIGTAGTVGTGAVDPLREIASICKENNLWFHVDGAYGALAAVVADAPDDLHALSLADSVAVDPHKWLYSPIEAGCALVRDPHMLTDAFSYHPPYYKFEGEEGEEPTNFYEMGPQNSRGFRALKVWLGLRHAGRAGYERMISDDIRLAKRLFEKVRTYPELEACTQGLSITTFRYAPTGLAKGSPETEEYLNKLNTKLLEQLQNGGEAFCSNTVVHGKFVLRVCIVNFRTTAEDVDALPNIVVRLGRKIHKSLRDQPT